MWTNMVWQPILRCTHTHTYTLLMLLFVQFSPMCWRGTIRAPHRNPHHPQRDSPRVRDRGGQLWGWGRSRRWRGEQAPTPQDHPDPPPGLRPCRHAVSHNRQGSRSFSKPELAVSAVTKLRPLFLSSQAPGGAEGEGGQKHALPQHTHHSQRCQQHLLIWKHSSHTLLLNF